MNSGNDANSEVAEVVWHGGQPVGYVTSSSFSSASVAAQAQTYAVHSDNLGTPRLLTNASGQPVWQWAYSAFGDNAAQELASASASSSSPQLFGLRYPGQYFDAETGQHYNYFRTYDPESGRYTQADPIGLDGGWNRFGYVGGNALWAVDPKGLSPEDVVRIHQTYRRVVDEMTRNGQRISVYVFNNTFAENRDDDNPYWPNSLAGTLNSIFRDGRSTLICGQQWDRVRGELIWIQPLLDHKWSFEGISVPGHSFGSATSSNPGDPSLIIDP